MAFIFTLQKNIGLRGVMFMDSFSWIDDYVDGTIDLCFSNDVYEIYKFLNINIIKLDKEDTLLCRYEAVYIRNYFGIEVVFIRDDLPHKYEKFVLAHELGHAILHVEATQAAYNGNLINKGKLEKQADYFAIKLLDIAIDRVYYEGYTCEQIAKDLCVADDSLNYIIQLKRR